MSQYLVFYGPSQGWYRPGERGYTDMVLEAGRFTREEADAHAERGNCFVVEDGSEEMKKLCNRWERYFLPKIATRAAEIKRLTAERDANRLAGIRATKRAHKAMMLWRGLARVYRKNCDAAVRERDAAVEALRPLFDALEDARDHLQYTGYGDSYERSAARQERLPERIAEALEMGSAALTKIEGEHNATS